MNAIREAAARGYGCLSSWADLLDRINVFPVADGDTGTNLRISLAPLQNTNLGHIDLPEALARAAIGNSGNIAVAFLREFLRVKNILHLPKMARAGSDKARRAVLEPKRGTMLDVFDVLAQSLVGESEPLTPVEFLPLCGRLQNAVLESCELLPELKAAGVVDSGALAMFIFFEGFFKSLTAFPETTSAIPRLFAGKLALDAAFRPASSSSHCIDVLLDASAEDSNLSEKQLAALGESIVVSRHDEGLKIHLHTDHPKQVRGQLASMGEVLSWKDEDMAGPSLPTTSADQSIHIMTDAAGSLTRELARQCDITLLDSYIVTADRAMPESLCSPDDIYHQMRNGDKITTAQASVFERHHHYESASRQYRRVLYICTGSAYTGNFATASDWQSHNALQEKFTILDSGAASGRLALIALLTARFAGDAQNANDVIRYAKEQCAICREYVFIHTLQYLVAGGRISKAKGFLGDFFRLKPIISPMAGGVKKQGVARNQTEQLVFASNRLLTEAAADSLVLLQYSDNKDWVEQVVCAAVKKQLPQAEVLVVPLSLTSGVHMGPGTWAMAFAGRE